MSIFEERKHSRKGGGPPSIRLRPNSDPTTIRFKIRRAVELTNSNSEVRIVVTMRGREKACPENAEALLKSVLSQIVPQHACLVSELKLDGSQVICTIGPIPMSDSDSCPGTG